MAAGSRKKSGAQHRRAIGSFEGGVYGADTQQPARGGPSTSIPWSDSLPPIVPIFLIEAGVV